MVELLKSSARSSLQRSLSARVPIGLDRQWIHTWGQRCVATEDLLEAVSAVLVGLGMVLLGYAASGVLGP